MGNTLIYFALLTLLTLYMMTVFETWVGTKKEMRINKVVRFILLLNIVAGIIVIASSTISIVSCILDPIMVYLASSAIFFNGYLFCYSIKNNQIVVVITKYLNGLAGLGGLGFLIIKYHSFLGL